MKPRVLYCYPELAGKKFRPSNGTEGMMFEEAFCMRCINEKYIHTGNDDDKKCSIYSAALVYDLKDKEYPKQWRFGKDGYPECSAWVRWDWGRDDDGNWNDPPAPMPIDPKQLVFPFVLEGMGIEEIKTTLNIQPLVYADSINA